MADSHEGNGYGHGLGLERLIFFSDAVFAIAITLLVLDIKLPDNLSEGDLPRAIGQLVPRIFGYIVSFLVLGLYWVGHHRNFSYIKRYDIALLWVNLIFLMFVAFLPFPTSVLGRYRTPFAVSFYAASVAAVGLMDALLWIYVAFRHRLVDPDLDPRIIRFHTARLLASVVIFLASIPIAIFIDPSVGMLSWLLNVPLRPFFRLVYKIHD